MRNRDAPGDVSGRVEPVSVTMQQRLAILQDISKTWLELMRSLRGLNDEQIERSGTVGDWSVKQVMGHIAYWDAHLIDEIKRLEAGQESVDSTSTDWNLDHANASRAAEDARRDVSAVKVEMDSTHQKLMDLLEVTPVISREAVRDDTYEHYPEHTAAIRAWRATLEKAR